MSTTITMKAATETRHDVRQGKRVIGFISHFGLRGVKGWRFIPNREEIAAKVPVPPIVHDTADGAFAALSAVLAGK